MKLFYIYNKQAFEQLGRIIQPSKGTSYSYRKRCHRRGISWKIAQTHPIKYQLYSEIINLSKHHTISAYEAGKKLSKALKAMSDKFSDAGIKSNIKINGCT